MRDVSAVVNYYQDKAQQKELDCCMLTPQKTKMKPENTSLEKEKHLQTANFWVPC